MPKGVRVQVSSRAPFLRAGPCSSQFFDFAELKNANNPIAPGAGAHDSGLRPEPHGLCESIAVANKNPNLIGWGFLFLLKAQKLSSIF